MSHVCSSIFSTSYIKRVKHEIIILTHYIFQKYYVLTTENLLIKHYVFFFHMKFSKPDAYFVTIDISRAQGPVASWTTQL